MDTNNQRIGNTPFFWGYNVNFICGDKHYRWSYHDELRVYLGDEQWSELLVRGADKIEEYIRTISL